MVPIASGAVLWEGDNYAHAIEQAQGAIDRWCDKNAKENAERAYWEEREVITKG